MKIGIDIDNVIADSYPAYLIKYNAIYQAKVSLKEVLDFYYLNDLAKKSGRKVVNFIDELVIDEEFQLNIPPLSEAAEIINSWLKKGFGIHYVTARPKEVTNITIAWLKKHNFWLRAVKVDLYDERKHRSDVDYKRSVAQKNNFNFFIEDNLTIAKGMHIKVFLVDQPWNQGKLPVNIVRVANFREIDKILAAIVKK